MCQTHSFRQTNECSTTPRRILNNVAIQLVCVNYQNPPSVTRETRCWELESHQSRGDDFPQTDAVTAGLITPELD